LSALGYALLDNSTPGLQDQSGSIDQGEFQSLYDNLQQSSYPIGTYEEGLQALDANGDGQITLAEYFPPCSTRVHNPCSATLSMTRTRSCSSRRSLGTEGEQLSREEERPRSRDSNACCVN